jgi:hypothetical protein
VSTRECFRCGANDPRGDCGRVGDRYCGVAIARGKLATMSRSRRHVPIVGMTLARSEKADKRSASGRLRMLSRQELLRPLDEIVAPDRRSSGSPSIFAKDGKCYVGRLPAECRGRLMRK